VSALADPAAPPPNAGASAGNAQRREEADDLSRFLIHSPSQIAQILRAIGEQSEIVTAYFNRGREFLLTAIAEVDQPGRTVTLDQGADAAMNQKLLASDRIVLVSAHDKVKVQFSVKRVRPVEFEGRPAFEIDLPGELLKMQRREYFRVRTTANAPVRCKLPAGLETVEVQVLDVSIGGLAAHVKLPDPLGQVGTCFAGATVTVGEEGTFIAELELRNAASVRLRNGADAMRVGFRFVHLPDSAQKLIQRYILKIERDRRNRERELNE
jgi:flagellar brake protein